MTPAPRRPTAVRILAVVTGHDRYEKSRESTGLWLGELSHFWEAVTAAGHTIEVASPHGGAVPLDPRSLGRTAGAGDANRKVLADADVARSLDDAPALADVDPQRYGAIYLVGGHGAMWDFRGNAPLVRVAEAIDRAGGIVAAVCHGVAGLLDLRAVTGGPLVAGRVVTGFSTLEEQVLRRIDHIPFVLQDELERAGALYRRAFIPFFSHVERDGRLITGQNPASTKAVARAVIAALAEQAALGLPEAGAAPLTR